MDRQELLSRVALLEEQVNALQERVQNLEGFRGTLERLLLSKWPEYEAHREEGM